MKLVDRPSIGGPVFVGSYSPGDLIDNWEPTQGNIASLKSGTVTVLVRIVNAENRNYVGELIGFENYDEYEFEGKKPGDTIRFNYDQIFSCSR